ncbi:MAG TPA: hypothetical protein VFA86_08380 [Gammaproteobacteria bacterium]|nr:hypothetical protein [Gammaproteobacteria bacterium]
MELIRPAGMPVLRNPGVESRQVLFPGNSASARLSVTSPPVDFRPAYGKSWATLGREGHA